MAKHAVELYDAGFARTQQSTGVGVYVAPPQDARRAPELSPELQKKLLDALAKEAEKRHAREEERRRRDPTYRPDAIDLNCSKVKAFDRYVDYYLRLAVSEFASDGELRAAFKALSLQLHPDKQAGKTPAEAEAAQARYFTVSHTCTSCSYLSLFQHISRRGHDTPSFLLAVFGLVELHLEPTPC